MLSGFPQFVPSRVCLSCDGCCRFPEPESFWRPRVMPEERLALADTVPTAELSRCVSRDGCLVTTPSGERHRCHFFSPDDHVCAAYDRRPFECQTYPVLVGWFDGALAAALHLSCPHVQDHWGSLVLADYGERLRAYFKGAEARHFLFRNAAALPDYSGRQDEVDILFPLDDLDPAGELDPSWIHLEEPLEAALRPLDRPLSEFAPAAAAGWQAHFRFELKTVRGVPCLFATSAAGAFLYLPPLGPRGAETLNACFDIMAAVNGGDGGVARVENVPEAWAADLPDGYEARPRGCEYLYRREDIARLSGSAYKSKRSDINQAVRRWQPRWRAYRPEDRAACERLWEDWAARRRRTDDDVIFQQMIDDSRAVHRTMLRQFPRWNVVGRVAEVDGRIAGYTFGYPLTPDTFCVLLEVTDLAFNGLAAYVFQQFCADPEVAPFTWINAMDDAGLPSLARVKDSFRPTEKRPVYTVTPVQPSQAQI